MDSIKESEDSRLFADDEKSDHESTKDQFEQENGQSPQMIRIETIKHDIQVGEFIVVNANQENNTKYSTLSDFFKGNIEFVHKLNEDSKENDTSVDECKD